MSRARRDETPAHRAERERRRLKALRRREADAVARSNPRQTISAWEALFPEAVAAVRKRRAPTLRKIFGLRKPAGAA